MPQSLAKVYVHLVFSTLHRQPWLNEATRAALFAYLAGIFPNHDCPAVKIGGTADHVQGYLGSPGSLFHTGSKLSLMTPARLRRRRSACPR